MIQMMPRYQKKPIQRLPHGTVLIKTLGQESTMPRGQSLSSKDSIMLSKEKIDSFIRVDTYRVLSKGFSYPDEKKISEMKSIVEELISSPHLDRNIYHYLEKILSTIEVGELQKEYQRLFLKGTIPIYESSYNLNFDVIPNVSAFYTAFGLSPKSGESPDSLPYELEFASILSLKKLQRKIRIMRISQRMHIKNS